jgi:hypothetical protein
MKNPALRAKELRRLFDHRYGPVYPDDDAAREDLSLLLGQLSQLTTTPFAIDHLLDSAAPWLSPAEREMMKREAAASFAWWTADDLAQKVRLTMDQRMKLGIRTIGAVDFDADARARRRKEMAAERARKHRRRAVKKTKRPQRLSDRAMTVWEALPPHSWHSITWLIGEVDRHPSFADGDGKKPAAASLRRLVTRAIENLVREGVVQIETRAGQRGFPTTFVTRDVHCVRETVPEDTTRTKQRAQC